MNISKSDYNYINYYLDVLYKPLQDIYQDACVLPRVKREVYIKSYCEIIKNLEIVRDILDKYK